MPPHNVLAEWIEVPPPAPRYARVGLRASFARLDPASGRDVRECGCCRANMASPSRGMNCPRFAGELPALFFQRAQGRPGACCTRGLACDLRKQKCTRAYRAAGAFRPSLRNGLRLTSCSSRRTALLPPLSANTSRQRSASTAAPEPHDFAVRSSCTRQSQLLRPPHLTARS
jgi:hypothetical protein